MAYVSKEKKAKIKAALSTVVPKGWKWSLRVNHHSSITMTISAGPNELTMIPEHWNHIEAKMVPARSETYRQLNVYHIDLDYAPGKTRDTVKKIVAALNTDNYDRSDAQTDFFDVGHYVHLHIGRWDKPFVATDAA